MKRYQFSPPGPNELLRLFKVMLVVTVLYTVALIAFAASD